MPLPEQSAAGAVGRLASELRELRRIGFSEQRLLPPGWRYEARDAGVWGAAGLYIVSPNNTATFVAAA